METQNLGRFKPRVAHVVGVAHPADRTAFDRDIVLHERENVRHDLHGVIFVRQAVDHGHAAVVGKGLQAVLTKGADHHEVAHAAHDAGRVFDRLGAAELRALAREVNDVAAELIETRLKGDARAGARLFENHQQHLAAEGRIRRARLLKRLDLSSAAQHRVEFVLGEVGKLQKMPQSHVSTPRVFVRLKSFAAPPEGRARPRKNFSHFNRAAGLPEMAPPKNGSPALKRGVFALASGCCTQARA